MATRRTIEAQLRDAIDRSGVTCYRIAKETGLSEATVGRFVNGFRPLHSDSLDRICQYMGLELVESGELKELRALKRKGRR